MKTKNILKIGIFSIALFALLISPVLKNNILQVRADGPDTDNSTSDQADAFQTISDIWGMGSGFEVTTEKLITSLKEERANDICKQISYDDVINRCAAEKPGNVAYRETICKVKASLARTQCEFVIGILEGLGAMFGGIINSEIEWILNALNPATYGGIINDGVEAIWTVLRNIVNAILVLGLIGIAIATILGYEKYAWKQILWKLILVALLVNFSLVIAGTVVDASNYLTGYFLSISQENGSIAPRIMSGYGYKKIAGTTNEYTSPNLFGDDKYKSTQINQDEVEKKGVDKFTVGLGNAFIIAFIMILTGGFAVIALLAIYLTIIIRNIFLIMLLGLSSIAFAAWIFPDTEKYWKMWWEQFIKWCFFPVIFAFMLYLGLTVMDAMPAFDPNSSMAVAIIYMTLFSMFLVGGLIFSLQSGGAVSKYVMQQSSKIGAAAGAFVSKKTTEAVKESPTYKKAGKFLTKVPLLGGVGQEMMVAGEKAKATRVKEHEKNLENLSLGDLKELEKAPLPSPLEKNAYERRIALTNKLADMGELGKESVEFIKMHRDDSRLNVNAITKAIPHYFKLEKGQLVETGDTIEKKVEALSRIKPDKIRDKTQTSDFIKDIVKEKEDEAKKQGKSEQEIKDAGNKAFEETIQEIAKKLSPAQLAGWWQGISPKDMVEGEWGGPEGKIAQAIKKDPIAKKKFYDEAIPTSTVLRAASGINVKKDEEKGKKEKPPYPGWVKNGNIWRPPEE